MIDDFTHLDSARLAFFSLFAFVILSAFIDLLAFIDFAPPHFAKSERRFCVDFMAYFGI